MRHQKLQLILFLLNQVSNEDLDWIHGYAQRCAAKNACNKPKLSLVVGGVSPAQLPNFVARNVQEAELAVGRHL